MDTTPPDPPVTRLTDLGGPFGRDVALTFDDGPEQPWTPAVLDHLEAAGVPATFFVLGSKVAGHEPILRRMVELGCGVEVHGWRHQPMTELRAEQVAADIGRTGELILAATGRRPRYVRPPHGAADPGVLEQIRRCGMAPVFWSAVAWDWTSPGVDTIVEHAARGLRRGAVLLLHDGGGDRSQTVEAVPRIIGIAADRGLRAVRLA